MIFQHRLSSKDVPPDFNELYRYAGYSRQTLVTESINDLQMQELAQSAVNELREKINCRAVYAKFSLDADGSGGENCDEEIIRFAGKEIKSHHLTLNLKGCHNVILFAATLGPEVDKLIQKTSKINPAKSVMLQAGGAMYIEQYVELLQKHFQNEEEKNNNFIRPRYSPGFGDVGLEVQKIFFELLQCQKNLALTLNDSLIMSPEKSVTAFVGISNTKSLHV